LAAEHIVGRTLRRKENMDTTFVDKLREQIDTLSEEELNLLWRWITIKYMYVAGRRPTKYAPRPEMGAAKSDNESKSAVSVG